MNTLGLWKRIPENPVCEVPETAEGYPRADGNWSWDDTRRCAVCKKAMVPTKDDWWITFLKMEESAPWRILKLMHQSCMAVEALLGRKGLPRAIEVKSNWTIGQVDTSQMEMSLAAAIGKEITAEVLREALTPSLSSPAPRPSGSGSTPRR